MGVAVQESQDREGHIWPALYEDPVPVDFPNLTAPEKHQVGQDQHGGGTRCEGSVESTAGLWGEELNLIKKSCSPTSKYLHMPVKLNMVLTQRGRGGGVSPSRRMSRAGTPKSTKYFR